MSKQDMCSGVCAGCERECDYAEDAAVTLELDDGITVECDVLTVYEAGGRRYAALLPLDENGLNEDGEVWIYRFDVNGGDPRLDNIESEEEYEAASEAFDRWLDSQEYDELVPVND